VTVSNALGDTGRVSRRRRGKILSKAAELEYRPNHLARALRAATEALRERAVDGLVVFPCPERGNRDYFAGLVEDGFPLVFATSFDVEVEGDSVGTDKEAGGRRAGEHFLARGRRRVAFVPIGDVAYSHDPSWIEARHRGLDQALVGAGAPPALVVAPPVGPPRRPQVHACRDAGHRAMRAYLAASPRPAFEAVSGVNDSATLSAMEATPGERDRGAG
jgi:DNA-binding LacI/PurR family transcriptional regulator